MVGYFSLNVPSGLGVYWIANNLITTLTTCVCMPCMHAPSFESPP